MVTTVQKRLSVEANHKMGGNKFRSSKGCDVCSDCDLCPFTDCRASLQGNRMVVNRKHEVKKAL